MRECLKRFVIEGLAVSDFDRAYEELLAINAQCAKSKDSLTRFIEGMGADPALVEKAMKEMTKPLPPSFAIPTTPNAKEILQYFSRSHILALVTGGHPPFQLEKLEKAGIDRAIFSKIAIPEDSIKKPFYERLITEFSVPVSEVFVCGDRVAMDLIPAYELGITTVHMRWGRGERAETEQWIDYAISDLSELKRIIKT